MTPLLGDRVGTGIEFSGKTKTIYQLISQYSWVFNVSIHIPWAGLSPASALQAPGAKNTRKFSIERMDPQKCSSAWKTLALAEKFPKITKLTNYH